MPHKDPEARKRYVKEWNMKNADKVKANHKRWRDANPEKIAVSAKKAFHRYRIRRDYDLSPEAYADMVAQPCEACKTTERRRAADHDHKTGRLRGALCQNCNLALGLLGDDTKRIEALLVYLMSKRLRIVDGYVGDAVEAEVAFSRFAKTVGVA